MGYSKKRRYKKKQYGGDVVFKYPEEDFKYAQIYGLIKDDDVRNNVIKIMNEDKHFLFTKDDLLPPQDPGTLELDLYKYFIKSIDNADKDFTKYEKALTGNLKSAYENENNVFLRKFIKALHDASNKPIVVPAATSSPGLLSTVTSAIISPAAPLSEDATKLIKRDKIISGIRTALKISEIEANHKKILEKIEAEKAKIAAEKEKIQAEKKDFETKNKTELEKAKTELKASASKIEALEADKQTVETQKAALETEKATLEADAKIQADALQKANAKAIAAARDVENIKKYGRKYIADLEKKHADALKMNLAEKKQNQNKIKKVKSDLQNLQSELDNLRSKGAEQKEIKKTEGDITVFTGLLKNLNAEAARKDSEISKIREQQNIAEKQLQDELREKIKKAEQREAEQQQQFEKLKAEQQKAERQHQNDLRQIQLSQYELDQANQRLYNDLQKVEKERNQLAGIMNNMQNEISAKNQQLAKIKTENKRLADQQRQTELEAEQKRQAEIEAQKKINEQIEQIRKAEEAEKQRQAGIEAERIKQEEIEAEQKRQADVEAERIKQEEIEAEQKRQAEIEAEKQRQAEIEAEKQRQAEIEAEKQRQTAVAAEAEQKRQAAVAAEAEQKKQAEIEAEAEQKRQADIEAEQKRQADIEAEQKRQADIEAEQKRQAAVAAEAEQKRQAEIEAEQKKQAEIEAEQQRQTEIEAEQKRQADIITQKSQTDINKPLYEAPLYECTVGTGLQSGSRKCGESDKTKSSIGYLLNNNGIAKLIVESRKNQKTESKTYENIVFAEPDSNKTHPEQHLVVNYYDGIYLKKVFFKAPIPTGVKEGSQSNRDKWIEQINLLRKPLYKCNYSSSTSLSSSGTKMTGVCNKNTFGFVNSTSEGAYITFFNNDILNPEAHTSTKVHTPTKGHISGIIFVSKSQNFGKTNTEIVVTKNDNTSEILETTPDNQAWWIAQINKMIPKRLRQKHGGTKHKQSDHNRSSHKHNDTKQNRGKKFRVTRKKLRKAK